jgi:hypothetical protein
MCVPSASGSVAQRLGKAQIPNQPNEATETDETKSQMEVKFSADDIPGYNPVRRTKKKDPTALPLPLLFHH